MQDADPSVHGETAAFRAAGRQPTYRGTTMVTTLSPCWYCSGLIRQFGISRLVVGESRTFPGQHEWLAAAGGARPRPAPPPGGAPRPCLMVLCAHARAAIGDSSAPRVTAAAHQMSHPPTPAPPPAAYAARAPP